MILERGRICAAVATVALALALVGCTGAGARQVASTPPETKSAPKQAANRIEIAAGDLFFEPKTVALRAGSATFVVRNTGAIEHNFIVETQTGQSLARIANIEVGKTEEVAADLRPGTYPMVCNLPGHKEAGMVGTITVTQ